MPDDAFIDFEGRLVFVTGASSGLGRAIAIQLAECGAKVVLSGRDDARLQQTAEAVKEEHSVLFPVDLVNTADLLPAIKDLVKAHGRIYGFCHSAGVIETRPLNALKLESLRSIMEINVHAGLELAKCVTRRDIMAAEGGSILFIASIAAWIASPGQVAYSATKGAVLAAARTMAVELARRKIRVNTLSPGLVKTPMVDAGHTALAEDQMTDLEKAHPLGPGRPEDVARAAAFMLAPQNQWMTGTDLILDGGFTAR